MKQFIKSPLRGLLAFVCMSVTIQAYTQNKDTITMNLNEAEQRFLDSNYGILAAHYNIDAFKSLIEQAKKWDNPVLNTDHVIAANGKFLPYGKDPNGNTGGQYFIQVQQLIRTAGKRNKLVDIAVTNTHIAELQFQDLVRNLRYQLHTNYYTLLQLLRSREIYNEQLSQLNKLSTAMHAQLEAGNIAQKDYLRIQALIISLQQDIASCDQSVIEAESNLKTILRSDADVFIKPSVSLSGEVILPADIHFLVEQAKQNNANYLLQKQQEIYQQQNLTYQKALRSPDISMGPEFDKSSNFAPNYFGLALSIPLPILNKNTGNIRSAEFAIKQQHALTGNAESELYNNISNSWQKLMLLSNQSNAATKEFYSKYELMFNNMLNSYKQKQVGLLEFLDFFNAYTDTRQKFLLQQLNLQLSKEELNYYLGTDIIK